MSLAKNLLNLLNESNDNSNTVEVSEAKKSDFEGVTLSEYFSGVFGSNLETVEISLDESTDSSDLYVDTEINSVPFTFRFYLESEQPVLDVVSWNESKDEAVTKSIKLSKKMINSNGDLVVEENLHNLPSEKISEAVNSILPLVEVTKIITRKDPETGKIVKRKVTVSAGEMAKKRKEAAIYRKKNKARLEKQAEKRNKRMEARGYTASQLKDINKRRQLKGLAPVDKFGKEA